MVIMNFDIEAIKRKMLVKYPFFGSIVANVDYKEKDEIPTAGTDGKTIYYNPQFLKSLKADEQTFIFAHEVCHIAFDHINRSESKIPEIWNIATDGVINQFLKQDGLKIVEGGIDIAEAINYDAEQLYNKLLKATSQSQNPINSQNQNEENKEKSNGNRQNSNDSNSDNNSKEKNHDVGHDTHSMWEDAIKRKKENNSKQEEGNISQDQMQKEREKKLEAEIVKISHNGEKDAFKKNIAEKRKNLEELKNELSMQAIGAGTSTNRNQIFIKDIGKAKPILDWRYILREAVNFDLDWSYKNAYVEDGIIKANLEEQLIPETEIVLDTSGSINEQLLKNFLRCCKSILAYSKIKVGCFDTEFYGFQEIRKEEDIENMKFEGGGGTDFSVAVRAFTKRVRNKIIFTDGVGTVPNVPMDIIWIVFGRKRINPKGGRVIYITEEQLNKLFSYEQDYPQNGIRR